MFRPYMRILTTPILLVSRGVSSKKFPAYKSLEKDDIARIQKSWSVVRECNHRFLQILHTEMLCDIKMYLPFFNSRKNPDVCVTELPEFKNHPRGVFTMLDCIVGQLENENVAIAKMIEVGERHGRIGISRNNINLMVSTIYHAVECTVGPCKFDWQVDQSWEKFLTNFNEVVGVTASRNCAL